MATIQITFKDNVYAAVLQTFEGATDADRLTELKQYIRSSLRDKARLAKEINARELANATMRAAIEQINVELAE